MITDSKRRVLYIWYIYILQAFFYGVALRSSKLLMHKYCSGSDNVLSFRKRVPSRNTNEPPKTCHLNAKRGAHGRHKKKRQHQKCRCTFFRIRVLQTMKQKKNETVRMCIALKHGSDVEIDTWIDFRTYTQYAVY